MKYALSLFAVLLLVGCGGKLDYIRPTTQAKASSNSKVIERPREAVWNSSVPELGKRFFVINNLDKSSGLINVSYTGDPEKYIDCGHVTSYVRNARGERTYSFPGAKGQQQYEVMNNGQLFFMDRRLTLEGRANLVFEEVTSNQTRVTVNTRYVVQRQITSTAPGNNIPASRNESISFNSGSSSAFSLNQIGQATECVSTGALERELLSVIK